MSYDNPSWYWVDYPSKTAHGPFQSKEEAIKDSEKHTTRDHVVYTFQRTWTTGPVEIAW